MKEIREYEDLCDEVQALYEEDLRLLKEVELLEIKQDQERYLRLITQAILHSKANAFETNKYIPNDLWKDMHKASYTVKDNLSILQTEIVRCKAAKQDKMVEFRKYFVSIAKTTLEPGVYEKIYAEAKEKLKTK